MKNTFHVTVLGIVQHTWLSRSTEECKAMEYDLRPRHTDKPEGISNTGPFYSDYEQYTLSVAIRRRALLLGSAGRTV